MAEEIHAYMFDFDDFFENALSGYVIANEGGTITRVNEKLALWLGTTPQELAGKNFSQLFTVGGRIYYETHLRPLLNLQGFFDEVALELKCGDKQKMDVLVNALLRRNGENTFIRFNIIKATDRRKYEENLKSARTSAEHKLTDALQLSVLREQFIAVLGHDLRNPLGSIMASAAFLSRSELNETNTRVLKVLERSAFRMEELIQNVMDFARTRMGEAIVLKRVPTDLVPVLNQVVDELQHRWPDSTIETDWNISTPIHCDAYRIAQLFSNLLANAITHGAKDTPITVRSSDSNNQFELVVCNAGPVIPVGEIDRIFEPFKRESIRSSLQGLGLGLYIASQIAKAHEGNITASSTEEETCFTFSMASRSA